MTQESPISPADTDSHWNAELLGDELKHRSTRGGAVMIISYGIQLMVGIGGMAVLARLLTPRDFGYLAMVATLLTLVMTLREFILAPAVHHQELSHEQASGLFWINCLASVAVAGGVALMAPVLAWFFHERRVLAMTLVMSIGVLISMLGMLHVALLRRQMKFGAISIIEIGASVAGVMVGVAAARMGAEYWALVYQQLAVWVWQTGAAWVLCTWRPSSYRASAFRADEGMRSMLRFGQHATASRLIMFVSRNMDVILIGHFSQANVLGLYQKAYQWAMMPFWQIFIPLSPVAVASLSRLQNDPERYRVYARTTLLGLFGLTLPGTVLLLVESDTVIRLLMGSKWLEAIPMLRVLSVGAFFSTFTVVTTWMYLSEGRTNEQLRWSLTSAPVIILSVAIGIQWGAIGVARGFAIGSIVLVVPGVWYCLKGSPLTTGDFVEAFWRAAASSILAGVGLWVIKTKLNVSWHAVVELVVYGGNFAILYVTCWLALPGGWSHWRDFVGHFRELRQGASG